MELFYLIIPKDNNIFFCKICVYPSSKPHIEFNDDGICSGCIAIKEDQNRLERTRKSVQGNFDAQQKNPDYYNCIVPSSGGKIAIFK